MERELCERTVVFVLTNDHHIFPVIITDSVHIARALKTEASTSRINSGDINVLASIELESGVGGATDEINTSDGMESGGHSFKRSRASVGK